MITILPEKIDCGIYNLNPPLGNQFRLFDIRQYFAQGVFSIREKEPRKAAPFKSSFKKELRHFFLASACQDIFARIIKRTLISCQGKNNLKSQKFFNGSETENHGVDFIVLLL
jgi:hypothetical protein